MKEYKPETGDAEDKVLELAKKRRKSCIEAESKTRTQSEDDVKFAAGFQWPDAIQTARETDPTGPRPCLTINKTGQFVRQVVNDSRQNSPAIKVFPIGGGADQATAKIFNGLIRDIEQRTDAKVAYDTAIESAARGGEGYFRLISRYVNESEGFDQELAFQRISNYAVAHLDPSAIDPVGSDAGFGFVDEWMSIEEYKNAHGDDAIAGLDHSGLGEYAPQWIQDGNVLVSDYYSVEDGHKLTLALLKNGSQVILEELKEPVEDDEIISQRSIKTTRCVLRKISGVKVLEKTIWPCKYVPLFRVVGEEFVVEGVTYYQGLIRPMKDSQRMYNYWMSNATEKGALESKAPYIGAEGQFEGHEHEWRNANRVPMAYLEYKQVELEGTLAPPPQRNTASFAGAGDVQMAQLSSDDMKATAGIYNAGLGEKSNERSGKAIRERQREADTGTFHYVDNLSRAMRHCGRVLVITLPKYKNKEEIVRIVGEDGKDEMQTINGIKKKTDDDGNEAIETVNDIRIGRYDVAISVGPSYTTRRIESADSMMAFVQAVPSAGQAVMDLMAKSMDWPGAEEIAERLRKMLPPNLLDDEDEDALTPEKVQGMMQELQQSLMQQFSESKEERETAVKEYEAQTKRLDALSDSMPDEEKLKDMIATMLADFMKEISNG
jgi:hypothetical protein